MLTSDSVNIRWWKVQVYCICVCKKIKAPAWDTQVLKDLGSNPAAVHRLLGFEPQVRSNLPANWEVFGEVNAASSLRKPLTCRTVFGQGVWYGPLILTNFTCNLCGRKQEVFCHIFRQLSAHNYPSVPHGSGLTVKHLNLKSRKGLMA